METAAAPYFRSALYKGKLRDAQNPEYSLSKAVSECVSQLGEIPKQADLAFVFVSSEFAPQFETLVDELRRYVPGLTYVFGTTGYGIVGNDASGEATEVEELPCLSITLTHIPQTEIIAKHLSFGDIPDGDAPPYKWSELLGVPAFTELPLSFVVVSDPAFRGTMDLLAGLDYAFPHAQKIGGLSSAGRNGLTAQWCWTRGRANADPSTQSGVYRAGASVLALHGEVQMELIIAQGCRPLSDNVWTIERVSPTNPRIISELSLQPPKQPRRSSSSSSIAKPASSSSSSRRGGGLAGGAPKRVPVLQAFKDELEAAIRGAKDEIEASSTINNLTLAIAPDPIMMTTTSSSSSFSASSSPFSTSSFSAASAFLQDEEEGSGVDGSGSDTADDAVRSDVDDDDNAAGDEQQRRGEASTRTSASARVPPASPGVDRARGAGSADMRAAFEADDGEDDGVSRFLVRSLLGFDRQGGMVVGDTVRVGEQLRFMVRDQQGARQDLQAQGLCYKRAQLLASLLATPTSPTTTSPSPSSPSVPQPSPSSSSPPSSSSMLSSQGPSSSSVLPSGEGTTSSPAAASASASPQQQQQQQQLPSAAAGAVSGSSSSSSASGSASNTASSSSGSGHQGQRWPAPALPPPPPFGMLMFTCNGRGSGLYGEESYDAKTMSGFIPVPVAGFQCNGEIGSVNGTTHLHGFTCVVGVLRPTAESVAAAAEAAAAAAAASAVSS